MSGPGEMLHVDYGPDWPEEIKIKEQLAELQREYQERAKPLCDRLVEIRASKPVRFMVIHP